MVFSQIRLKILSISLNFHIIRRLKNGNFQSIFLLPTNFPTPRRAENFTVLCCEEVFTDVVIGSVIEFFPYPTVLLDILFLFYLVAWVAE
jgi:hypothetical protein